MISQNPLHSDSITDEHILACSDEFPYYSSVSPCLDKVEQPFTQDFTSIYDKSECSQSVTNKTIIVLKL